MVEIGAAWKLQRTSRMCFACGRENPVGLHLCFYEDPETHHIVAPLNIPDSYQGYPGVVHGGVLATILDETTGRAINIGRDEEQFWVTARLEMRYRRPTPTETPLTAVGWVVSLRSRTAEVAGEIRLPDGTVTAEAMAVVVYPSADMLKAWEEERKYWG